MDYYFNKTLNFQKVYQEDLNKITTTNPSFQKSLPKSKSSNELVVKKQEKENSKKCPHCNTNFIWDGNFCKICGAFPVQ